MPESLTICNTSPLLYLHLVNWLVLLRQVYETIIIPPAVRDELLVGAERGINVPKIEELSRIEVLPLRSPDLIPLVTDLGRGEAETIALSLEYPGSLLIIDDALARRIARVSDLKFTGTLGVVVKAKQRGLLDAVDPVIAALREAGLWLGDELVSEVLRQAGEE